MLNEMLKLIPDSAWRVPPAFALGVAGGGAVLAILGARFSRSLVTLGAVALGTILGLHLPRWMGWTIDPMGPAFGAAIVLGVSGFLLHRTWIGLWLSSLLASLTGLVAWFALAGGTSWRRPAIDWSQPTPGILSTLWQSLPPQLNRTLPIALGIAVTVGVMLAAFAPKAGRILLYSMTGVLMMSVGALVGFKQSRPQWIDAALGQETISFAALGGCILLSCIIQWLLQPRPRNVLSPPVSSEKRSLRKQSTGAMPRLGGPQPLGEPAAIGQKRKLAAPRSHPFFTA